MPRFRLGMTLKCPSSIGWMKRSPPSDPSPDELPPGPRASPDCSSDSDDSDAGFNNSQLAASQGSPSPPPPPSLVIPSALTPPPSAQSYQGQESSKDEIDVWVSSVFINAVKSDVFHLLNLTLHKYQRDNCFECRIDLPSHKQHQCKDVIDDNF